MNGLRRLLLLMALSTTCAAEPLLNVEVVLIRHESSEPQHWLKPETLPDFARGQRLAAPTAGEPAVWTTLEPAALRLTSAVAALRRRGNYSVLLHTGWRQPVSAPRMVLLEPQPPALTPTPAEPAAATVTPPVQGLLEIRPIGAVYRMSGDFLLDEAGSPRRVTARQNLKAGELRYLDNARLGVLIQVSTASEAGASGSTVDARSAPPSTTPAATGDDAARESPAVRQAGPQD